MTMDHELAVRGNQPQADRAAHKRIWKGLGYVSQVVAADAVAKEDWTGYRMNR
jgi:hypothetical protein